MKSSYLMLFACIVLGITSIGKAQTLNSTSTDSPSVHAEKLRRLADMFHDLDASLILKIGPGQDESEALNEFRKVVRDWSQREPALHKRGDMTEAVRKTYPSLGERYLRSMQGKVELIQQPKTALIEDPSTLKVVASLNPDNLLLKVSGVFTYSEYVPTPTDVLAQAKTVHDAKLDIRETGGGLCTHVEGELNEKVVRNCFLRTGVRNMLLREFSGVKGIVNYVQNPEVQQQLAVPASISNQNKIFSGEVDFDPSKLFLTGSDWLAAYSAAQLYGKNTETKFNKVIVDQCEKSHPSQHLIDTESERRNYISGRCIARLAAPHKGYALLAALTPTVVYTIKSQFDFIKNQGDLIPAPYATKRLGDLTLTLDLTRLVPSAKSRQDALATLAAAQRNVPVTAVDPARADLYKKVVFWASKPERLSDPDVYDVLRIAIVNLKMSMVEPTL